MMHFKENASVIFTDEQGRLIDTFVVFDTDEVTGLTHINHGNLRVAAKNLVLHSKTVGSFHLPLADAFSFEILKKMKAKYREIDTAKKPIELKKETQNMHLFAKAS